MRAPRQETFRSLPLRTERLTLRLLQQGDATAVSDMVSDPDVIKQTLAMTSPYPRDEAEAWIAQELAAGGRKRQVLAIEDLATGRLVGTLSINVAWRPGGRLGTVGYWIGKPYWGQGYGTEALEAFLTFCADSLSVKRFRARVFEDNEASRRVLERNGFRFVGRSFRYVPKRGGWRRIFRYRLKVGL